MRWFITFKRDTSHYGKCLVLTNMSQQQAWDVANKHYGCKIIDTIWSEQEFANILPQIYCCKDHWIVFGEDVSLVNTTVSLEPITKWFKTAKPEPVMGFPAKWVNTQMGAHFEEVAEMVKVLKDQDSDLDLAELAFQTHSLLVQLAQHLYESDVQINLNQDERVELLDALADQVVTLTGVAYFSKFKWDEALTEVSNSNNSKFENGKPVLREDGKIMKGKDYFVPKLEPYV